MATYEHESYWPRIQELAQGQKYSEIESLVSSPADPKEQVALARFAVRGLMFRSWTGKTLIPVVRLGDWAVEKTLRNGDREEANIICYNMSANLADCWNDGFQRSRGHFEKGLAYAERALELRRELKKGPIPFSLAYWAQGMHLFSLGKGAAAEAAFEASLESAIEAAKASELPTAVAPKAPFYVLIAHGYSALARLARRDPQAQADFERVLNAFDEMKGLSEDARADAELGLEQLRFVRAKIEA